MARELLVGLDIIIDRGKFHTRMNIHLSLCSMSCVWDTFSCYDIKPELLSRANQ